MTIRQAAVAGRFYQGSKNALEREIQGFLSWQPEKRRVTGLISPHAGYIYSGACAGKGFSRIEVSEVMMILGISHQGGRYPFAIDSHDWWETPLGRIAVDSDLRMMLINTSPLFRIDPECGQSEHSLEVQVPFIQFLRPDARILPIHVHSHRIEDLLEAGIRIGGLLKKIHQVTMVASTDMSHFLSAEEASQLDGLAIERILALDAAGLFETVKKRRISMCGVAPTVVMLAAAIEAGARKCDLVEYTHSGLVSGHFEEVVGYLSAIVY